MSKLAALDKIIVESSGYNNTQSVLGYIFISVPGVFEILEIEVEEVVCSNKHDTFMCFTLGRKSRNSSCNKSKVLDFFGASIEYDEDKKVYLIVDEDLVFDLFSQYGENAG
jgi:hypothetical protein